MTPGSEPFAAGAAAHRRHLDVVGLRKRHRFAELGYAIPDWLRLVPVDFEGGASWAEELRHAGFHRGRPAVIVSTGVSMYLTQEATALTLRQVAGPAPGTTLAMTFLLPPERVDEADRPGLRASQDGARAWGTPLISFYAPDEMLAMARAAGFENARHVPGASLADRCFTDRADGLRPSSGEDFLLATT